MNDFVGIRKATPGTTCQRAGCPGRDSEYHITGNGFDGYLCRRCFVDAYPVLVLLMMVKGMIR